MQFDVISLFPEMTSCMVFLVISPANIVLFFELSTFPPSFIIPNFSFALALALAFALSISFCSGNSFPEDLVSISFPFIFFFLDLISSIHCMNGFHF